LIGRRWRDELDDPPSWRDFTREATLLVDYFRDELKATPTFAPVFEVTRLDAIAVHLEVSAESLASVEKLLGSLLSLMDSQFGTLAQTIAGASIGIREQIRDFSPYIAEKTGSFVGRHFLFGLLGAPTKFTTLGSSPIKNLAQEILSVEKSCRIQNNLIVS
jgi:hypothetical protein